MRTAVRFPQSPVRSYRVTPQDRVSRERGAARKAASSLSAPAFLTQRIDDIRPAETDGMNAYGIDLVKSYKHVLKCCKRFCRFVGLKFDFTPRTDLTKSQLLGELIDYFDKLIHPHGLDFFVSKKTPQGDETSVLECAVYRYGSELENTIVIMYVAPARYLSPKSAEYFKRFMKFFSDSTNIPLGIKGHSENFYLYSILDMYEEDPFYDEDDEDEVRDKRKAIAAAYNEDGEFWNLFDEIGSLPKQDAEKLADEIDKYRSECPEEELGLMESLIEGIPIVKDMNYYWFEFNPEDDGLPDAYGNTDGDGWSSGVFASAILYSEQDGISEQLLESINSEVNAGIMMSGWNIHQYLYEDVKKEVIADFMRCKDKVGDFNKWLRSYYMEMEEFDKYGKSK